MAQHMGLFICGLVATLAAIAVARLWYLVRRSRRFDKDRSQHRLAAGLVLVAVGQGGRSRADIAALLERYPRRERAARLKHAVTLASTSVSGEAHERVAALAREFV